MVWVGKFYVADKPTSCHDGGQCLNQENYGLEHKGAQDRPFSSLDNPKLSQ
jgi:hypothetical protein